MFYTLCQNKANDAINQIFNVDSTQLQLKQKVSVFLEYFNEFKMNYFYYAFSVPYDIINFMPWTKILMSLRFERN